MNKINWLITDFDRTLIQLFSDTELKHLFDELKAVYMESGITEEYLIQMIDPYKMWFASYKYLQEHYSSVKARETHNIASSIITKYELIDELLHIRQFILKYILASASTRNANRLYD